MNWQPIETAPKDGSIILLWARIKDPLSGFEVSLASWMGDGYEWVDQELWRLEATHWMPLPEPPA